MCLVSEDLGSAIALGPVTASQQPPLANPGGKGSLLEGCGELADRRNPWRTSLEEDLDWQPWELGQQELVIS